MKLILERATKRLTALIDSRIATSKEAIVQEASAQVRSDQLTQHRVFGPYERLRIADTAKVSDTLFNTVSGLIDIGDFVFFGHGAAVLTGTHDITLTGAARQEAIPLSGRDIVICAGAWISSRATILGPCRIGENAVVAAGAVVTNDVMHSQVVAGVPAKPVRLLTPPPD